jgi:hypothetical protein
MKKALIVLLILGLAGGLFAQSFSGNVITGARIDFTEDVPIMATADGDNNKAVKAAVNFNNSGDDWTMQVSTSALLPNDGTAATGPSIGNMFGRVTFGDIFQLSVGKGIGGAWATGGYTDASIGAKRDVAYRLNIKPIAGLDFGFRFTYPKGTGTGAKAVKLMDFFLETGIGARYDAGVWNAAAGVDLNSEANNGKGQDLNAYFGFNFLGLGDLVTIHAGLKANNALDTADAQNITLFEKFNGSIVGLDWYVQSKQVVVPSPIAAVLGAGVSYGIPISEKASATVGADADLTLLEPFNFDDFGVWAELVYKFNGKVSATTLLNVDVYPEVTPWLRCLITYNF